MSDATMALRVNRLIEEDAEAMRAYVAEQTAALREENARLRSLAQDVARSGVEFDDERLRYVTVQVDREVWEACRALLADPEGQ